jgi:hypothetical protein
MVLLEPDVAEAFSDGASVNQALRAYLRTSRGKLPDKRVPRPTSRKARRQNVEARKARSRLNANR